MWFDLHQSPELSRSAIHPPKFHDIHRRLTAGTSENWPWSPFYLCCYDMENELYK